MCETAYICVEGPPGAGKTTFIRQLLASNRTRFLSATRIGVAPPLEAPREIPEGNEETECFLASGAHEATLILHPPRGHGVMLEWLDDPLDPEEFDPPAV